MIEPKVVDRLGSEKIIWMTTVGPGGQPQSYPVWFVLDGDEIRVWSLDQVRITNLAGNSKVSLHLNDNGRGGNVVTIEGEATVDASAGPGSRNPAYVDRYQPSMDEYGWTWDYFDSKYSVPIRVRPTKVQSW